MEDFCFTITIILEPCLQSENYSLKRRFNESWSTYMSWSPLENLRKLIYLINFYSKRKTFCQIPNLKIFQRPLLRIDNETLAKVLMTLKIFEFGKSNFVWLQTFENFVKSCVKKVFCISIGFRKIRRITMNGCFLEKFLIEFSLVVWDVVEREF